jgi:hypothetical protein
MKKQAAVLFLVGLAAWGQTAQKPAAAAAAVPKLTGFPFQDESLRYSIKWPSGLSLGDATFRAWRTSAGWNFEMAIDAGVPGFRISDRYRAQAGTDLCSTQLEREIDHAGRRVREKTSFDQQNRTARRETLIPEGGGHSDFDLPSCARDALAFLYYARQELGQGRVAPAQQVFFGSAYSVSLRYTGEAKIALGEQQVVTDRVAISVRGPKSDVSAEAYFARDAARTPLLVKLPLEVGTFSMELVR